MTHIVHLGTNGFPQGMAAIERIRLLSLALLDAGCSVRVISHKGVFSPLEADLFPPHGQFQGIDYDFVNDSIVRPEGFIKRNLAKILGRWQEWRFLRSLKRKKQLDTVILSSMDLGSLLYYRILCSLLSVPLIYQLVELNSAMANRQSGSTKVKDALLEKYALKLPDAILPISQLLTELCQTRFAQVPLLPIPVVCEYEAFDKVKGLDHEPYFLYCGSSSYAEVVFFLIDAFARIPVVERVGHKLYLIIGGDQAGKIKIQSYIQTKGLEDQVIMFSGLTYEDLIRHYKGADALLIPLRPRKQDQARFPHKIGEYLASGKPIITTNVGEIPHYFTDEHDALVAEQYDTKAFAEKMRFVLNYPSQASMIGNNGRQLGLKHFDCYQYGSKLKAFIKSI
ncbi:MAG: glycosyltransferase family 4 protein [Bacteroidia bacterium]